MNINMRTTFSFLIVLLLVLTFNLTTSFAQTNHIYWADAGTNKIQRANLDGTNVQDILTGFGRPTGITLDISSGKIYWTDSNRAGRNGSIQRMNLDGTNVEPLVVGKPFVGDQITLDISGGKMYWALQHNKIQRANLDGTNVEDLVIGLISPRGIALDLSRGKMYWTDLDTGKIQRANLDGSNIEDLVTGLDGPAYMALDFNSGKIYWTDWRSGKVQRSNFDGSNLEDIVIGLNYPIGIALDSLNGKMYWGEAGPDGGGGSDKIQRANLDGTIVETLVTGLSKPIGIALGIPQGPAGLRFSPNVIADQTFTVNIPVDMPLPIAVGGTAPYIYSISALPAGLYFDAATRQIYGTPTTVVSAHSVTYTVSDANGSTASLDFTITVQNAPPVTDLHMYWADAETNKIQRANLDGTNVQDIFTGFGQPIGITLDISRGKIYWTDRDGAGGHGIQRMNLDGTNVETLVVGHPPVTDQIALDISGGKIYWVNLVNKIQRANLDGTNIETLVTTGLISPKGIALDVANRKMYWADWEAGKIQRANLDGTNVEDVITGLDYPNHIALDLSSGKLYWPTWFSGKIQRANLDGSNLEDLVDGLGNPPGIALDISGGKMYWTDTGSDKIQRANLDGTNVETLVTDLRFPVGIALSIPQVPPGDGLRFSPGDVADQTFTVGTYASLNLPIATGGTEPYSYTLTPNPPAGLQFDAFDRWIGGTPTTPMPATPYTYTAIDATGSTASLDFTITVQSTPPLEDVYMYWIAHIAGKVQRANLDGSNVQDLVSGLVFPDQIALDIADGKMYWTDHGTDKIQRANLDGSNVQDLITTDLIEPWGIALDVASGKMYWTDAHTAIIQRANLDGSNVETLITELTNPAGLALDVAGGKMYWAVPRLAIIQRANLDGSNVETLITTGLQAPLGIALDLAGGKLYWTDYGTDKIQRSNLDGSDIQDIIETLASGVGQPHSIALDVAGGKLYWTDWTTRKIRRANLDGSGIEELLSGLANPLGIALSIPQVSPGDGLRFSPNMIADQTFTVGTYASLNLPIATGGAEPYSYTLTPDLPAGLQFDAFDRWIGGTPTTPMQTTPYTYTAMDTTGASASLTFTITVTSDGTSNLDVNGDGQVNVVDLAIVALFYGTRVPVGVSLPADVNADGVVDILDLTAVAQGIDAADGGLNQLSLWEVEAALLAAAAQVAEIGVVAGAPMGLGTGQHALSNGIAYGNVAAALANARQMTVSDVHFGRGLAVLEGLLQLLAEMGAIPETTALLPNYPNPFNPETWIPYHLAKAAHVTLTIYDMRGVAVRELLLGHQAAGVYQSRGRAAYWDGRNAFGEPVASGVYFYTLTAGEFTATRKMLIAK